ncbi:tetratricopeptide repeat protein [Phormidesmis sp. 146-12]
MSNRSYSQAEVILREVVQLDPNISITHFHLCRALRGQQKLEEAARECQIAMSLLEKPSKTQGYLSFLSVKPGEIYSYLGYVLMDQKRFDEAVDTYHKAIQLDKSNASAYHGLGNALREQGKLDGAIAAYRKATQLVNDYTSAYANLGNALREQKKLDEAIAAYSKAISLPNFQGDSAVSAHAIAHTGLGLALQSQGKFLEAREELSKAMAIDPNYDLPRVALSKIPSTSVDPKPVQASRDWESVKRAVFRISINYSGGNVGGTGWLIKRVGDTAWVVTNRHVACGEDSRKRQSSRIEIKLYGEPSKRFQAAAQCFNDPDLALLEVRGLPNDIIPLSPISKLPTDRSELATLKVTVIGYPNTSSTGLLIDNGEILNATTNNLTIKNVVQGDGSSGSPILNEQRQVIGTVSQTQTADQIPSSTSGFLLAIPIDLIQQKLNGWLN